MATYPAKGGADFVKAPAGTHLAICTLVADVGLQPGSPQFPDPKIKIWMRWEIPAERVEYERDGQQVEGPQIIYGNYTASMGSKANLRKLVESWRGAKFTDQEAELFDIRKLLNQTCMLQVVHSPDGKYANVANVMAPPKGTAKLKPEGTCVYYGPDDDVQYDSLPKFLKEKVDSQLGESSPAATTTKTTTGTKSSAQPSASNPEDQFADAQADRQAAKAAGAVGPIEDDEIPF